MKNLREFFVGIGDGDREVIMEYNETMNFVEEQLMQDEVDQARTFEAILDHRKTKKSNNKLLLKWTTGEETWEPLSVIGEQNPVTVAMYAVDQELLNNLGWRQYQKYVNRDKKFIRTMKKIYAVKENETKIKFGIEVPKNYKDALRLHKQHGITWWKITIKTELDQINSYGTFMDYGRKFIKDIGGF